jgi:hypothetical protein
LGFRAQVSPLVQIWDIPSPKHCGVAEGWRVGVWVSVGVMVGLGFLVIALALIGFWLRRGGRIYRSGPFCAARC